MLSLCVDRRNFLQPDGLIKVSMKHNYDWKELEVMCDWQVFLDRWCFIGESPDWMSLIEGCGAYV